MKRIITVGFEIPGLADRYEPYDSSQSLLDADIVVFSPELEHYHAGTSYQGEACYDEDVSFRLKEDSRRWRAELSTALADGKTVVVFLRRYESLFVHTGRKEYSGTGRNARVTAIVERYNNYAFLPVEIPRVVPKEGTEVKFGGHPVFATFWTDFRHHLKYECYFDEQVSAPLMFTTTGNKPVGALLSLGKGHLVLLPTLVYPDEFVDRSPGKALWTKEALEFGSRLVQALTDIDSALRSAVETTPAPEWAGKRPYSLQREIECRTQVERVSQEIQNLVSQRNVLLDDLRKEGLLRNLLFEKGKPLEDAIAQALGILGYKAERYEDGSLEIDHVIVSPEGDRFVGEAEGRDNARIAIDKFRQLESNIQEDLERDDVEGPAVGVLFGNGFRLTEPTERECQFTDKCMKNAQRLGAVLVPTSELFRAARYVKESGDEGFARECRKAMIGGRGAIVSFPVAPEGASVPRSRRKRRSQG